MGGEDWRRGKEEGWGGVRADERSRRSEETAGRKEHEMCGGGTK
jgi:hypothetical protein